ncbi:hypothetical protein [Coralloluteibacterium thermophilus]|uniref:Uncharacterized protein n=1 Tax=Coralloluteibacterium thermophilum TaxID=2707049 RepID=A0ABV9NLF1_9GAMM
MSLLDEARAILRESPTPERMRHMADMFPHLVRELEKPPVGFEEMEKQKHALAEALTELMMALAHVRDHFGQDPEYSALFVEVEKPWRKVSAQIEALLRMAR